MRSTNKRIFCVDDDDDTCSMLSSLLEHAGYEVKSASSIAEGLKLARSERFDLYVLDNRVADGTGLELCRRIRGFDSQTLIIFFSRMAHESDKQRGLDAGAQDYLIKPNDLYDLTKTIMRLLDDGTRLNNSTTPIASAAP